MVLQEKLDPSSGSQAQISLQQTPKGINVLNRPKQFDFQEYLDLNNLGLDAVKNQTAWKNIDVPFLDNRIAISKELRMTKKINRDNVTCIGNITIENRTGINMGFLVIPSEESLRLDPEASWIGPHGSSQVSISAKNDIIKQLFSDGFIKVLAVPIYHKSQLTLDILNPQCESLLTSFFSGYSIETHTIEFIYSGDNKERTRLSDIYCWRYISSNKSRKQKVLVEKCSIPDNNGPDLDLSELVEIYEMQRKIARSKHSDNQKEVYPTFRNMLLQFGSYIALILIGYFASDEISELMNIYFGIRVEAKAPEPWYKAPVNWGWW